MVLSYPIIQAERFEMTKSGWIEEKKVTEFLLQG